MRDSKKQMTMLALFPKGKLSELLKNRELAKGVGETRNVKMDIKGKGDWGGMLKGPHLQRNEKHCFTLDNRRKCGLSLRESWRSGEKCTKGLGVLSEVIRLFCMNK